MHNKHFGKLRYASLSYSPRRSTLISSLFIVTPDPGKSLGKAYNVYPPRVHANNNNNITFQWGMLNPRHLVQLQPAASSNRTVRPLALLFFFFSIFSLHSFLIVVLIILVTAIYELHLHYWSAIRALIVRISIRRAQFNVILASFMRQYFNNTISRSREEHRPGKFQRIWTHINCWL